MKKTNAPSSLLVHGAMLISTTLVSSSFVVAKAITDDLDPAILIFLRFAIATALFMPYIHRHFSIRLPSSTTLLRYSIISATMVGFLWLMFLALRHTSPLNTSVIFTLVPGISGIYAMILLKEHLGKNRLLSLAFATTGAIWVVFKGNIHLLLDMEFNTGDLIFFAGCLLMGFYNPLIKLFHQKEPVVTMTFWILVTGTCWLLPLSGSQLWDIPWLEIKWSTWAGIVYLAIFTTIITFFISQWATIHLGPTRVMAYSFLYPPIIVIFDFLLGREIPSVQTLPGILLIIPAMIAIQRDSLSCQQVTDT